MMITLSCSILTFIMAGLHLLLLCGAPLGEYVLGGTDRVIPVKKRKLNVFFLGIFILLGFLYLFKTPVCEVEVSGWFSKPLMILYTLFLAYAVIGNLFMTDSKKEKLLMTPLSVVGFVTSLLTLVMTW